MIIVPGLIYLLKMDEKKARATSVICILPMVITSGIFYTKNNSVNWKIGLLCAIGGIIGGAIGAKILNKLLDVYLKIIFAIFLVYASYKMIW